jgi:hypothetical protein
MEVKKLNRSEKIKKSRISAKFYRRALINSFLLQVGLVVAMEVQIAKQQLRPIHSVEDLAVHLVGFQDHQPTLQLHQTHSEEEVVMVVIRKYSLLIVFCFKLTVKYQLIHQIIKKKYLFSVFTLQILWLKLW